MRPPATLTPWFSTEQLLAWLQEAPTKASYQKRLAIWLTHVGPFSAHQVAQFLGVSKQAIWLWVGQYNRFGPSGLERRGRGGRRWSLLDPAEEAAFLAGYLERASRGDLLTARQVHQELCQRVGREVSLAYVYKLFRRNEWRKLTPRPRHVKADPAAQAEFKKTSPPGSGS